jgi:uncharacterized SAM-binding protein YcdF (DUF218 family)
MLGRQLEMKDGPGPALQRKPSSVFNRLIVLIAFVLLVIALLSHAGSFLVLNAPEHADAILALGGGADGSGYWHALRLQKQAYADMVVLAASASQMVYGQSEAGLATEFLNQTAPGLVEVCPTAQGSIYGEAVDVKRCLAGMTVSSVLIVASDFQTRRALETFRKRLPQYHWSIAASSAPYHNADQWWKHRAWAKTVLYEWEEFILWKLIDQWKPDVELR